MLSISYLFEALADEKVDKVEVSKGYITQDLKDRPPESEISTYRRKVVFDKDGNKHIINLAILKGRSALVFLTKQFINTSTPKYTVTVMAF